jgi:hypothetical protein
LSKFKGKSFPFERREIFKGFRRVNRDNPVIYDETAGDTINDGLRTRASLEIEIGQGPDLEFPGPNPVCVFEFGDINPGSSSRFPRRF